MFLFIFDELLWSQFSISLPKNWADEILRTDKNIKEIGYFEKGDPCVEIKNCPNADFLEARSYTHF